MGGVMNGISAYGSHRVFGGTFLVFSDYMRASIRLSALSKLNSIWIFTHDSIGLGEDGPTHQPISQLMSLRSIPNLNVFRPADRRETLLSWRHALNEIDKPSALIFSRQSLPDISTITDSKIDSNTFSKGAFSVYDNSDDDPEIITYLQVKDINEESKDKVFIFNGWMFASGPSLNPFDHPVYDLWVIKCYN